MLFIRTRTSTEGKLSSGGRLGGPVNSLLSSADSAIHSSDTLQRADVPSDTMHGGIQRASATTGHHHRHEACVCDFWTSSPP